MNTEIIDVWQYSVSLKIRPLLFGSSNTVLGYDFQRHFRECEKIA